MDTAQLREIYDLQQRVDVHWPGIIRDVTDQVVRHRHQDEKTGFIAFSRLDEKTADAAIEEQIAFFESLGRSFEWKVYDYDRPADLRERLAARGFEIEPPEALMILDLEQAPDFYWNMPLPDNLVRVTDRAGIDAIIRMEEAVWETDHQWLGDDLERNLKNVPDQISIFAVMAEGQVVSAAWIYYHPPSQFGSLWGGTTLPAFRGRGYYTSLLAVRAREARERGYRYLTVDASPMSRPILEKHGFICLGFSTPCKWLPSSDASSGGEHG